MEDVKELMVRKAQQILYQHHHQGQQSVIVNVPNSNQYRGQSILNHPLIQNHHQQHQQNIHNLTSEVSHNFSLENININSQPSLIYVVHEEGSLSQSSGPGSPSYSQDNQSVGYNSLNPYLCGMCDKGFPTSARLNRHLKTHLNEEEKPHRCDLCSKSFSAKWNLDRHVKESHEGVRRDRPSRKDDPNRPKRPEEFHKCPVCEKSFSHRTSLTRHIRSHSDDKPYECEICEKAFVQMSDLDRHKRVHTGEKPFQCNQCDRAFTQSANLTRHLKYHESLKAKKIVYGRDMNLLKDVVDYKKLHEMGKGKESGDEETGPSNLDTGCLKEEDEDDGDALSD